MAHDPAYHCSVRAFQPLPVDDFDHPYPKFTVPHVPGKETAGKCEVPGCFVCSGQLRDDARKASVGP